MIFILVAVAFFFFFLTIFVKFQTLQVSDRYNKYQEGFKVAIVCCHSTTGMFTQIQEADTPISCGMIPIRKQLVIPRSTVMPSGTLTDI